MSKKKSAAKKADTEILTDNVVETEAPVSQESVTEDVQNEVHEQDTEETKVNQEESTEIQQEIEPVTEENTNLEDITNEEIGDVNLTEEEPKEVPEVPAPEVPEAKEEEVESGKKEIKGKEDDVQKELCKKYKIRFAQSFFMKIAAMTKEISLFSIIETWMLNKNAYIGLLSLDDFKHIKDVINNNTITYKYKVLNKEIKEEMLSKLEFNTQYAVSH